MIDVVSRHQPRPRPILRSEPTFPSPTHPAATQTLSRAARDGSVMRLPVATRWMVVWCSVIFTLLHTTLLTLTDATVSTDLPFPPRNLTAPYRWNKASFFFNVFGSANLTGSVAVEPALFGQHFPITGTTTGSVPYFTGEVVLPNAADDIQMCSDAVHNTTEFGDTFTGKVLLIRRGACAFGSKAVRAQAAGAAAMIVYGCPTVAPRNCLADLTQISAVDSVNIPVVYIQSHDGELFASYLNARNALRSSTGSTNPAIIGEALMIQTITTGPLVQSERDALVQIISLTTMNSDTVATLNGGLHPWTTANINNASLDPCLQRFAGVSCENGHIVQITLPSMSWTNPTDGTLPTGFGSLTQLRVFQINLNQFSGPVPASMCALTEMYVLDLSLQNTGLLDGFTSLPACFSSMTQLYSLTLNNNALSNLTDFGPAFNLSLVDISYNQIPSLPPSFSSWTALVTFNAASNKLTSLPDITRLTKLTNFQVGTNSISQTVTPSSFDGLSGITTLDLSGNHFVGPLPNLINCSSLKTLILEGNQFNSAIPLTWPSNIPNLVTLKAAHNQIISPVAVLIGLNYLTTIDLSYNNLTAHTGDPSEDGNAGALIGLMAGPSLVSLNVAHNQISGPWISGWFGLQPVLAQIYISYNNFTSIPTDLFANHLTTLDASHNAISVWGATAGPPDTFTYLNLRNNPLVMNPVPSWVTVSTDFLSAPGEQFSCPRLQSSSNVLMNLQVDAIFSGYNGCQCAAGTFGTPPLCYAVPLTATLGLNGNFSSDEVGSDFDYLIGSTSGRTVTNGSSTGLVDTSFGDSWYGNDRLTLGIQTSFVIDVSTDAAAIRYITVRIHINRNLFTHVTDVLSVYQGDASLSSIRISAIRGTDQLPSVNSSEYTSTTAYQSTYQTKLSALGSNTSLWEVDVLGGIATVSFSSRDSSGTHFLATYSTSTSCPVGYFFDTDIQFCRPNLEIYKISPAIRNAVFTLGSFSTVFVIGTLVVVVMFFQSPIIRAASRSFLVLTLVFLGMMSLGSLLYAAIPDESSTGKAICNGRVWLAAWPLTGILAVLLAKTNRISSIFTATKLQVRKVTDKELFGFVAVMLSVTTIFLIIYSGVPLNSPSVAEGTGSNVGKQISQCKNATGFAPWIGILLGYFFVLMIGASYLAFKTRDLPSRFNESTHIMNALFFLLFFGMLIVPLDFFIQDTPEAAVLIQGVGQALMSILLTSVIFLPKLFLLYTHQHEVVHGHTHLEGGKSVLDSAHGDDLHDGKHHTPPSVYAVSPVTSPIGSPNTNPISPSSGIRASVGGLVTLNGATRSPNHAAPPAYAATQQATADESRRAQSRGPSRRQTVDQFKDQFKDQLKRYSSMSGAQIQQSSIQTPSLAPVSLPPTTEQPISSLPGLINQTPVEDISNLDE